MIKEAIPHWNGKRIASEEDVPELERQAAVYEFQHRMPRGDAEHRAHHEYRIQKHKEAAAYHFRGMDASKATGDTEEGRKHALMYEMHLKALGHPTIGPVPNDIKALMATKQDKFYSFKPHKSDAFLLDES